MWGVLGHALALVGRDWSIVPLHPAARVAHVADAIAHPQASTPCVAGGRAGPPPTSAW
jgi:hypothetical protein